MSRAHPYLEVRKLPDTKIGPVLGVKVCYHQGRYGVEIMIESFFRDRTVSWVRIVNGINKYVTEMLKEILVAKRWEQRFREICRESQTTTKADFNIVSSVRSSSWTKMDRRWSRKIQSRLFWSVKLMIRLLRHDDTVHWEDDGAVRFDDLAETSKA